MERASERTPFCLGQYEIPLEGAGSASAGFGFSAGGGAAFACGATG